MNQDSKTPQLGRQIFLRKPRYRSLFLGSVLALAVGAEAYVLYFLDVPGFRVGMGLLFLALIMWTSARLGSATRLSRVLTRDFKVRRFTRLRGLMDELVATVRLLNGLKVGVQEERTRSDAADLELRQSERRIDELIVQIKDAAGKADPRVTEPMRIQGAIG